ncbi:hypothetical protein LBMAG42_21120 [Deltaproteobacteria bacterium]|nr:hypothetical protein LBMAG42_21120 [Deltaproteobacteria bacterium]
MAPNPDSKREPLPGYLVFCAVVGLAATEWSFGSFGQTFFVESGPGAHAVWLSLGSAVSLAMGLMLELQSRANEGDEAAIAGVRRARLHAVIGLAGGALVGELAGHTHSWAAGAAFGASFGTVASIAPDAPIDWLTRGRFALVGLLLLYTNLHLLPGFIGTAQRLSGAASALDWVERGGALVGVVAVFGAALRSLRMLDDARGGGTLRLRLHAQWIASLAALLAAVCVASAASRFFGGEGSAWARPGLFVALAWLAWAGLVRGRREQGPAPTRAPYAP